MNEMLWHMADHISADTKAANVFNLITLQIGYFKKKKMCEE